jgi:hypothetical protein
VCRRLLDADGAEVLERAAILHDVGYSPSIALTGFHALDGARYLRSVGYDERVTNLVAHHSCAAVEAGLRDLSGALADFDQDGLVADCLIFCDMTTRPDGGATDQACGWVPVIFEAPRSPDVRARLGALATSRAPRLHLDSPNRGHAVAFSDLAEQQMVCALIDHSRQPLLRLHRFLACARPRADRSVRPGQPPPHFRPSPD